MITEQYKRCEQILNDHMTSLDLVSNALLVREKLEGDEKVGGKIILRALEEPTRQIAVNAGLEPAIIVNQIKGEKPGIGFDAKNEKYIDMKKAGIVDPTKVSRSALQNAESISSMILTTEAVVTDIPEKKAPEAPQMPEGMY